ncbi:MAG: ABC transporter ATP-binding protein/permease [Lachnospiraceae bacterium]|nr:ABC transporter ATP-binding protein/permease [Lachnospiraceae bacterium]
MDKIKHTEGCDKKKILFQTVFGILENGCAIIFTILLADLTDFILQGDAQRFGRYVLMAAAALTVQTIMLYLEQRFAYEGEAEYGRWLRNKVYHGLLCRRSEEIDRPSVLNTYNSSIGELQNYISTVADYFILCITMVIAVVVMLQINIVLLLISVMLIPLAGYLNKQVNNILKKKSDIIFKSKENINYNIKQILDGFYSIKAYGIEERFTAILARDTEKLERLEKEKDKLNSIQGRLAIALRYMPQLIIPLLGGMMCLNQKLTVGQLLAANTVIWYIIGPLENLLEMLKNRRLLKINKEKIQRLTAHSNAEKDKKAERVCLERTQGETHTDKSAIVFHNVSFSYDGQRNVLDNISFSIDKGEHVLLVGKSGEGKSTLVKLLCGQRTADSGHIVVDGNIVFIPQEPYLFGGTIRENICLGRTIDELRLREISDAAGLQPFISDQENGLDTLIGEEACAVSGGQRRRIALARAMAQDATIYILDEPFSELDSKMSVRLQDNLSRFWADRTVLMISHQDIIDWHHPVTTYSVRGGKLCHEK